MRLIPCLRALILTTAMSLPLLAVEGVAPPAPNLNYQGRLVENGSPVSATRVFRFTLLDGSNAQLFQTGEQSVVVKDGLYAVQINGFPASVLAHGGLVLKVEVGRSAGSLTALQPNIAIIPTLQATTAFSVTAGAVGTPGSPMARSRPPSWRMAR